jgi:hypothetical protein
MAKESREDRIKAAAKAELEAMGVPADMEAAKVVETDEDADKRIADLEAEKADMLVKLNEQLDLNAEMVAKLAAAELKYTELEASCIALTEELEKFKTKE